MDEQIKESGVVRGPQLTGGAELGPIGMSFSGALELLKKGRVVARRGWNGKGMFLYLVPANEYPAQTEAAIYLIGSRIPYASYIAMKTVDGNVVPWVASQTCLLAEDWFEIRKAPATPSNGVFGHQCRCPEGRH